MKSFHDVWNLRAKNPTDVFFFLLFFLCSLSAVQLHCSLSAGQNEEWSCLNGACANEDQLIKSDPEKYVVLS